MSGYGVDYAEWQADDERRDALAADYVRPTCRHCNNQGCPDCWDTEDEGDEE